MYGNATTEAPRRASIARAARDLSIGVDLPESFGSFEVGFQRAKGSEVPAASVMRLPDERKYNQSEAIQGGRLDKYSDISVSTRYQKRPVSS
jgi:hypothetical protein